MLTMLKFETIEPKNPATATVILLHGLGASGHDLIDIPHFLAPGNHSIRFILPHAPSRSVTVNMGMVMPAWYDIYGFSETSSEDLLGLQTSQAKIDQLIVDQINSGILPERIILGGFSQGGALTLFTGLQSTFKLGGLIVLSAYFPTANYLENHLSATMRHTPIFLAHGNQDLVVPFRWGEITRDLLTNLHYPLTWHHYPIGHEVSAVELHAVSHFIHQRLMALA